MPPSRPDKSQGGFALPQTGRNDGLMTESVRRMGSLTVVASVMTGGCDRPPPTGQPPAPTTGSIEITEQTGLGFTHDNADETAYAMPRIMGAGAAVFDADGDGVLELYLVNGQDRANRLLRLGPGGGYQDVTDAAGLGDTGYGMGVAVADYDNDGDLDLYLTNYGPDVLYRNDGDGTFSDVTSAAGIDNADWACSAAFFDYDLDGFLDLFVANYVDYPQPRICSDNAGRPEYCGPPTASRSRV